VDDRSAESDRRGRAGASRRRLRQCQHFDVLGSRPLAGRMFTEQEDRPNGPPVAVLGYPLWQAQFAADPSVIGRKIMWNDVPVEVVGIMPDGFRLPTDFTVDAPGGGPRLSRRGNALEGAQNWAQTSRCVDH